MINLSLLIIKINYLRETKLKISYIPKNNHKSHTNIMMENLDDIMDNDGESQIIRVDWSDRWLVYYRLKDLEIECSCRSNHPLKAYPNHPQAAIQIWSVTRQFTANRQELIDWLNQCWEIQSCK